MGNHVVVFGATGRTGRHLVAEALAAGHSVVAFARRPEAVGEAHPRLRVVAGDLMRVGDIRAALTGARTALIAVGASGIGKHQVCARTTAHVLEAAEGTGVERIVCLGTGLVAHPVPWPVRLLFRHVIADKAREEELLLQSDTDWVLVRVPRLVDGHRGSVRVAPGVPPGMSAARGDVARFMVAQIQDDAWVRRPVGVSA